MLWFAIFQALVPKDVWPFDFMSSFDLISIQVSRSVTKVNWLGFVEDVPGCAEGPGNPSSKGGGAGMRVVSEP